MVTDLLLPKRGIIVPKPPSYIKLDMAFALGEGAKLGDKSRYRSHGTISGASWATGAHGKCLDFVSATPSYVAIPAAHTQLDFTTEDFSMIARLRPEDTLDWRTIFARGTWNIKGYAWYYYGTGFIRFSTLSATGEIKTDTAAGVVVLNTWSTLGVSRSGASVTLYKDGVDVTSIPGTHVDPATAPNIAYIGIFTDGAQAPLAGKMEFLRVFGGIALPASTHLAYHNALA